MFKLLTYLNPMYKLLSAIVFASLLFMSCQKDASNSPDPTPGGSDTTANPPVTKDTSYQPATKDSYWAYKTVTSEADTSSVDTLRATGDKKDFNAHSYDIFSGSLDGTGGSQSYMRSDGDGNMYLLSDLSQTGLGDGTLELLYTNFKQNAGFTWTYNGGTVSGLPLTFNGKILEKNITKQIQGKSYDNVIHSQVTAGFTIVLQTITLMTYDIYVAQGVGIIKIDTKVTTGTLKELFDQLSALGQDVSAYQDLIDSLGTADITISSELAGYEIKK